MPDLFSKMYVTKTCVGALKLGVMAEQLRTTLVHSLAVKAGAPATAPPLIIGYLDSLSISSFTAPNLKNCMSAVGLKLTM